MKTTIFAPATASGRAGVAVIRVSGPQAWEGAFRLSGRQRFTPRRAVLADLTSPSGSIIDKALILPFQAPASYTGEDVIEYHLHGGRAVVQAMLRALAGLPGHRLAEAGEFTRRAFENGKMDLTAAEAVADLIAAETEAQKQQAFTQMEGGLVRLYEDWTARLKHALAHLEADIEFPDEDLPGDIMDNIRPEVVLIQNQIQAHLNDGRRGERLRDGFQLVIIGAPNAGKSSLVNALAQRDIAIVSDLVGTTRDVVEAHLDIAGYPVILADTAGLNPRLLQNSAQQNPQPSTDAQAAAHEGIESEGIRRALNRAREADFKILLFDSTAPAPDEATLALADERSLIVFNKSDLMKGGPENKAATAKALASLPLPPALPVFFISAKTGAGIEDLLAGLAGKIQASLGPPGQASLTRARHRSALEELALCLARALNAALPELMAEDLRLCARAIGRITGRVSPDDLLDIVFRDFCIGK